MMTGFFPTDVIASEDESLHQAADRLSRENRLEFLKGYLRNEKLAELVVSLDEAVDHLDTEFDQDKLFLMKQSHMADLVWASTELKRVVAHWSDDEASSLAARDKAKHLIKTIDERIE